MFHAKAVAGKTRHRSKSKKTVTKLSSANRRRTPPAARRTARRAAPVAKPSRRVAQDGKGVTQGMTAKKTTQRQGFKTNEFIVYPAHGVGQIVAIEEQEVAGAKLELFVINFIKDKMMLRVPTAKIAVVGSALVWAPVLATAQGLAWTLDQVGEVENPALQGVVE